MPNSNPQRFDRAELADFYEKLVLYFELNDGLKHLPLSASSKGYRKLKQELNLEIHSAKTLDELRTLMQCEAVKSSFQQSRQLRGANIICVYNSEGNLLKSIFTQLRNAAAHAHIHRIKQGQIWYQMLRLDEIFPGSCSANFCEHFDIKFDFFSKSAFILRSCSYEQENSTRK